MGPTKGAVAVDEYTVHVELANPWPLFPRFIPWQMIVPKSVGDSYIDKPVGHRTLRFRGVGSRQSFQRSQGIQNTGAIHPSGPGSL